VHKNGKRKMWGCTIGDILHLEHSALKKKKCFKMNVKETVALVLLNCINFTSVFFLKDDSEFSIKSL